MKRMALLLAFCALFMITIGCAKGSTIVGKWQTQEESGKTLTLQLNKDNTFSLSSPDMGEDKKEEGTYQIEESTLKMYSGSGKLLLDATFAIEQNTLTLTYLNDEQIYTRSK